MIFGTAAGNYVNIDFDGIESYATINATSDYSEGIIGSISYGTHSLKNIYVKSVLGDKFKIGFVIGKISYNSVVNYKNIISELRTSTNDNVDELVGNIETGSSFIQILD